MSHSYFFASFTYWKQINYFHNIIIALLFYYYIYKPSEMIKHYIIDFNKLIISIYIYLGTFYQYKSVSFQCCIQTILKLFFISLVFFWLWVWVPKPVYWFIKNPLDTALPLYRQNQMPATSKVAIGYCVHYTSDDWRRHCWVKLTKYDKLNVYKPYFLLLHRCHLRSKDNNDLKFQ